MFLASVRTRRTALYLSILGLLAMVAAISAVSVEDPDGMELRVGMIMMTVGCALWLPWRAIVPAVIAIWLVPNYARALIEDSDIFDRSMLLEMPGFVGLAVFSVLARISLNQLEEEYQDTGVSTDGMAGLDPATGLFQASRLRHGIEEELVRSRRFSRTFALVLVGVEELRQRFDYRSDEAWNQGVIATSQLLKSTRVHIDRAYVYGPSTFALLLPETGEKEVRGLVRRLRRIAASANPPEGDPGGPLATHYGATFFPHCATTVDDLLKRAELALKLAERHPARLYIDGAEAAEMPPPITLRAAAEPESLTEPDSVLETEPEAAGMAPTPIRAMDEAREHVSSAERTEAQEAVPGNVVAFRETSASETPQLVHEAPPVDSSLSQHEANDEPDGDGVDREVDELLKHLDETLGMIRTMRAGRT